MGAVIFYNGYIMGTAFYKYIKNHKILCFLMPKTLYFVVVVAEREGFELSLLLGILWCFVVLCGILCHLVQYFCHIVVFCGISWYRIMGTIMGIMGIFVGKKEGVFSLFML